MKHIKLICLTILGIFVLNCSNDDTVPSPLADFQFLVEGAEVIFNGTVANNDTIQWDFGDGNSSSEEDPKHAYAAAGTYSVSLTVTSANDSFTETKEVTIQESDLILLTGGPARPEGKPWRLKKLLVGGEGAGLIEDNLGILIPSIDNLLDAVGLGASYEDTFTFIHDGTYVVDNKDGQSLMSLVFASVTPEHAPNIAAVSFDQANVPLANVLYTSKTNATWELREGDFTINALTSTGVVPVQFTDKKYLVLDEYLGFKEKETFDDEGTIKTVVIVKELTADIMKIALEIHTEPALANFPTLLFHLTLEAN
ncbi:PKD domain-containing protein [Flagellimonas onchidii]|uniref:PKD domain-containing protein n=1 Tax=Flagellimonas onchidii TaxID=2562684 RepID=UPI0010A5BA84|nr:PKD domain-containing protein [Allomuricauda onchidii]